MPEAPSFDLTAAHRYFATHCFNSAWSLLNQGARSDDDNEMLIALGHASLYHWRQRPDCTDKNLSIAHWMLARIYSTVGVPERARFFAERCRQTTTRGNLSAFFQGSSEEALARAARARGDDEARRRHLAAAKAIADTLEGKEKELLSADLESLTD